MAAKVSVSMAGNLDTMMQRLRFALKRIPPRKTEDEVQSLLDDLLEESYLDLPYLALVVSSCAIATFGLLSNSPAVIIGAMIIAPLMMPIRGMAFGALEGNVRLFRRGIFSVAIGTTVGCVLAALIGLLTGIPSFGSEILARSKPNLLDLGIAVAAGFIGGYGKVEPKLSATLSGVAIAVALMPPVCVVGLGISQGQWSLSFGAMLLYLTNLLGIALACMLAFLFTGFTPPHQARRALSIATMLTGILVIPLSVSFFELVRQARLEASLKNALVNRTITFQRVELLNSDANWLTNPPEVHLTVRAKAPITAKQVRLLEEFVQREMGQAFTLIFAVDRVREVTRDSPNTTPTSVPATYAPPAFPANDRHEKIQQAIERAIAASEYQDKIAIGQIHADRNPLEALLKVRTDAQLTSAQLHVLATAIEHEISEPVLLYFSFL